MKRFALLFSFVTALLFGATVSAQMGPPGPPGPPGPGGGGTASTKISLYSHRDDPMTYDVDGKMPVAENEIVLLLFYVLGDKESVPTAESPLPFYVTRDGWPVSKKEAPGELIFFTNWWIRDNTGKFSLEQYDSGTGEYRGVSYFLTTVTSNDLPVGKRVVGYAVFYNSRTKWDSTQGTYVCSGKPVNLGKTEYLAGYRVVYLGKIPSIQGGPGSPGGAGLVDVNIALCGKNTNQKIAEDFKACGIPLDKMRQVSFASAPVIAPELPAEVAGLTNPNEIVQHLSPKVQSASDSGSNLNIEVVLPKDAQGLLRYTVYTTTDLSKPFGEWSLLDEVLKTSEAKKVLADKSGMSYTLIRVEDYTVPTIILPKIGEKRFYRVVGE